MKKNEFVNKEVTKSQPTFDNRCITTNLTTSMKKLPTPKAVDVYKLNEKLSQEKKAPLKIALVNKQLDSTEKKAKITDKENMNDSNQNDFSISLKDMTCETADVSMISTEKLVLSKQQKKVETAKSFSRFYENLKNSNPNSQTSTFNSKFSHELSDFEMIKVIGKGTFGKVILVKSKRDQKLYALKCLKKAHIIKTRNLTNLKNEKKILETISSPFIIKLKFTFQSTDKIYMGFDYHNGGELFFHLSKLRKFNEEMVRFYAAEIFLALSLLHKNNIVYRDLKPENIILDEQGHIKLIDFGLAKDKMDSNKVTSTFCGTNEYIPPEVLQGEGYSFGFDWWGFGVIIYEMLFGRPPFYDQNKNNLFKKIVYNEPDYTVGGVKLSADCLSLLKSLLNKDPKMRIKPNQIQSHAFFKNLNFEHMKSLMITPPYKPKIKSREDLSNIDPMFLNEEIISPKKNLKIEFNQSSFNGF
jgi:tRNA A-37 threonylcarbamoyl transferase component Bud32